MVLLILKRHPPAISDFNVEGKKKLKSKLENEYTELKWPESYLYSYYFAEYLAGLKYNPDTEIILAHSNAKRNIEDAEATSFALNQKGIAHEKKLVAGLAERDLGALADQEYERIAQACGPQGIIHAMFYAKDYTEIMRKAHIEDPDIGENFADFIIGTARTLISLWRPYKKADDIIVCHTHSLRFMAIRNVIHYLGYRSFKDPYLVSEVLESNKEFDPNRIIRKSRLNPHSGYWWTDIGYGEFLTIKIELHGDHAHVSEKSPESIGIYVKNLVTLRSTKPDDPLGKYTPSEKEYLMQMRTIHNALSGNQH